MNRMRTVFGEMKQRGEKILVTYFPLCDPALGDQVETAGKYFKNGATVLEMGLPYENPCLDGKIVRESMERALKEHTIDDAFDTIKALRKAYAQNILQVMTYFEIIEKMGMETFARRCSESGADAVLTPNIPPEKMAALDAALGKYDIIHLRFSPYHLNDAAVADLKANADGYIFQQAVDGVTGPQKTTSPQVGINVKILKQAGITTPVVAGFGVSTFAHVRELKEMGADGVIVGSCVVNSVLDNTLETYIAGLSEALK